MRILHKRLKKGELSDSDKPGGSGNSGKSGDSGGYGDSGESGNSGSGCHGLSEKYVVYLVQREQGKMSWV